MSNEQLELFNKIKLLQEELTQLQGHYWKTYASFDTWQFWFILALFILPLITLYFSINKEKILLNYKYIFSSTKEI